MNHRSMIHEIKFAGEMLRGSLDMLMKYQQQALSRLCPRSTAKA